MARIRLIVIFSLLGIFVLGCGFLPQMLNGGATPEQAVKSLLPSDSQYFYLTKPVPGGAIVFFRDQNPNLNQAAVGHAYVKLDNFVWVAQGASMGSGAGANMPVMLGIGLPAELPNQMILDGITLDPNIRSVQVHLADGTTMGETAVNNFFGMIVPINAAVCRFQLRDVQNQVLHEYDLAQGNVPLPFDPEMIARAQKECK